MNRASSSNATSSATLSSPLSITTSATSATSATLSSPLSAMSARLFSPFSSPLTTPATSRSSSPSPKLSTYNEILQFSIPFRYSSNSKIPYPTDRSEKIAWADEQREMAQNALEPSSLEEFQRLLQDNFDDLGVVKTGARWIKLSRDLIRGNEIQVDGEDGIVFNVDGTIPEHLKTNLLESLNLALHNYSLEDQLTEKDTHNNPAFTALHFSYCSKYGTEECSSL
ncbi:hypothetical protein K435DRAFT_862374 [Dendrothele bispora CBS 962.96]|uniref:Uncharacterized protein n=1 Tax=Dendrothele bispora (strain CBS 962.96) TaxID=1314807 RepID=A0A4S8LTX4_DENBC|nr:hypothetical protein K435DRAFT_862374 [Dendrothele bispora CBS 962.96]